LAEEKKDKDKGELQKTEAPISERFTFAVLKEFGTLAGNTPVLSGYHKKLAQHLFLKIDAALTEYEKKRTDNSKPPIVWANINMPKLAVDAMHSIELGLDALIPNHLSPIPYLNGRTKLYDLDLRIGYAGQDYYRRKVAVEAPVDIIYELVYKKDTFTVFKRSLARPVESYDFLLPANPFDRGEVVGGFGYIIYAEAEKNRLVIVTAADFNKSRAAAASKDFWDKYPEMMQMKTVVHRTTAKLAVDPQKVNASYLAIERDEDMMDADRAKGEIADNANTGPVIEIEKQPEPLQELPDGKMVRCPMAGSSFVRAEGCTDCEAKSQCEAWAGTQPDKKKLPVFF